MKIRILILSLTGLIFFNSCSTDNKSSNSISQNLDPNTILPKTIIISNYSYEGGWFKANFFYDGNKIDHISYENSYFDYDNQIYVSGNGIANYTYNGNLITKIESGGGEISINFTYQNGKILSCNYINNNLPFLNYNINFQYDTNGTVVRTQTYTNNPDITSPIIVTLNDLSNGLPSIFSTNIEGSNYQSKITYNTTNSVYKNIVGFNNVLSNMFFNDNLKYTPNNSISNSYVGMMDDWYLKLSPIYNYNFLQNPGINGSGNNYYSYVYNEINFPTSYQVFGIYGGAIEYGSISYY